MSCEIIDTIDILEGDIRNFLKGKPNGGRYLLPEFDDELKKIILPLMIAVFGEDDWRCEYDFDEQAEWLNFSKLEYLVSECDLRCD